ncbi:hypothetical protein AX17_001262 [Amanita inopinata Kibby_2008]|nr:hypothetical protein AX17_001262 [Amanita inopinata Kibby_2008]
MLTMFFAELHAWTRTAYEHCGGNVAATRIFLGIRSHCYASLVLVAAIVAASILIVRQRSFNLDTTMLSLKGGSNDSTHKMNKDRPFGKWKPVQFTYPAITPRLEKMAEIKPIPYRPFRWGPYHITMGIRNMKWDDWIELDNEYERYQRIRAHRIRTRGRAVVCVLDDQPGLVRGGGEAAIELVHELAEYLSRRYPSAFRVTRHPPNIRNNYQFGWDGAPPIKDITIISLNKTHSLPLDMCDGERAAEKAVEISALLVQDDLAVMVEGKDGRYYFQAGAVCMAGTWRMQDKIGMSLEDIHTSGNVPRYQEKLQTSLERYFRRLSVDKPVVRNNYFVQLVQSQRDQGTDDEEIDPEELAWSKTTNGLEDEFRQEHPKSGPEIRTVTPEMLRLRTERQTLRRLPKSGAIIFTIRTYVVPVAELARERGVPGRMASALKSWPEDVVEYKGSKKAGWGEILVEYMERCHAEQIERGEVGEDEKENPY